MNEQNPLFLAKSPVGATFLSFAPTGLSKFGFTIFYQNVEPMALEKLGVNRSGALLVFSIKVFKLIDKKVMNFHIKVNVKTIKKRYPAKQKTMTLIF